MKRTVITTLILLTLPSQIKPATALDYYRYFSANYNQYRNQFEIAYQWYKKLLEPGSTSLHIYKGYIELLFKSGQLSSIVNLIPMLNTHFNHDIDMQLLFANSLALTGDMNRADDRFIYASSLCKTHPELAFHAAQAHMRRNDPTNALKVINALLNSSPRSAGQYVFYFLKSQIYSLLHNDNQALENILKSIQINPSFEQGYLLLALLYEKKGDQKKAVRTYEQFLAIAQSPLLKKRINKHVALIKSENHQQSNWLINNINTARSNISLIEKIESFLQKHPRNIPSRILKLKLLIKTNQHNQIYTLITEWIREEPTIETWYEILYQLSSILDLNKSISILTKQEQIDPNNPLVLIYLGLLFCKNSNDTLGLTYLEKANEKTTDKDLKSNIALKQALVYHNKKQYQLMLEKLEYGEQLGSKNPCLFNMLAYAYAKQNRNLDKALKLVTASLKSDNTNPYYLDTLALIHYARKEYKKAQAILETLAQRYPHEASIVKHLSTLLFQQGETHKAKNILSQAIASAKNSIDKQKLQSKLDALTDTQ